ncbi:Nucleolar MIF4G domain-containing protein 1 [Operophtera brumata]|uniref:Nucleolar MIF4G domain-containing protein 1 n=1 Tax=Operophtera brumata TaxID=104452 RepID=A0A0L7L174_OPEBR|nr:Nucleolar MIF4G domain-containing protein 1 [Operophtera brumata]
MKKAKSIARPKVGNSRKAIRKQKRQQKKVHRQEHYLKKKTDVEKPVYTAGRFVKRPADVAEPKIEAKKKKPNLQPTAQDILSRQRAKEMKEAGKLKSQMEEQRRQILMQANEDEDRLIKKLEKQLGLNKSKNKNNYFADDGLDSAEKHLAEVEGDSDFESDLAVVTGKELSKTAKKTKDKKKNTKDDVESDNEESDIDEENDGFDEETGDFSDENSGDDEIEEFSGDDEEISGDDDEMSSDETDDSEGPEERIVNAEELTQIFSDDEISHLSDDDLDGFSGDDSDVNDGVIDDVVEEKKKPDVWEDIYGRKRDKEGNIIKDVSADDKQMQQIKRQIKTAEKHLAEVEGDSDFESDLAVVTGKELSKTDKKTKDKKKNTKNDVQSENEESDNDEENDDFDEETGDFSDENSGDDVIEEFSEPKPSKERIVNAEELTQIFSDDEISHLSDDDLDGFSGDDSDVNDGVIDDVVEEKKKPDVWEDIYGRKRDKEGNIIKKQGCKRRRQTDAADKKTNQNRNSVNTALTQLWLDATVGPSNTPDRMVTEHAALISVLHANVGSEIGAHFLQDLCTRFDEMTRTTQPITDKRLDNLVSCLAHLYSFKTIGCVVVALRCVGGVMRKMEPALLKQFILDTQAKLAALSEEAASGSRVKFLLEVLMAVKNNNLSKIPNYDPSYQDELKKLTRSIVRKGNYITTLNIRLDDLLKADERGKWWVVGSAWEGNMRQEETPDFMDAFEKLQHLGLKGQQEREIVHLSIQYSIWDKIKDIENQSKHGLANLAQLLTHLIMEKGLPLSVLKSVRFMRQILLAIIMNEDLSAGLEVFHRIAKSPKLHVFRESLKLFIQHFLVKNAGKTSSVLSDEEMGVLRERAGEVSRILTMHDSKLKF